MSEFATQISASTSRMCFEYASASSENPPDELVNNCFYPQETSQSPLDNSIIFNTVFIVLFVITSIISNFYLQYYYNKWEEIITYPDHIKIILEKFEIASLPKDNCVSSVYIKKSNDNIIYKIFFEDCKGTNNPSVVTLIKYSSSFLEKSVIKVFMDIKDVRISLFKYENSKEFIGIIKSEKDNSGEIENITEEYFSIAKHFYEKDLEWYNSRF